MVSMITSIIIPLLALAIGGQCRSLQIDSRSRSRRASVSTINNNTTHTLSSRATRWEYVSCWRDNSNPRTLPVSVYVSGNTNARCQAECQGRGYIYAGTQYSDECYCGNTINNPNDKAPESDCNSQCRSDTTKCGGTWRLSIYKAVTVPDPTTTSTIAPTPSATVPVSMGCYWDNWDRTMPDAFWSDWAMTPESCNGYCANRGFSYAGTETGNQCYCSKSAPAPGRRFDDSKCNKPCPGRQSSMCGGDWALSVYSIPAAPPAPTTTSTTTTPTTTTSTTTTPAAPTSTVPLKALPADLNSFGCFRDAASMGFTTSVTSGSVQPAMCAKTCGDHNFSFAATQAGNQCLCGNKIDWSLKQPDSDCTTRCAGDQGYLCGSSARINVYSTSTEMTTGVAQPVGSGRKWLWAHHMVGNLQNGSIAMWEEDIRLAAAAGIDGFALNMGQASWQVDRVAQAYKAADNLKASSPFKLFLSFDMTAMYCQSEGDATYLASIVSRFATSPYQAWYKDRVLVTTFAGDGCRFGRGTAKDGWGYVRSLLKSKGVDIYLMPSIFVDIFAQGNMDWYDGHYDWDSAWPLAEGNLDGVRDKMNLDTLTPKGKGYMGNISPAFFTYYKPPPGDYAWNKNWIYRSDNWLLATRFEMLMAMRDKLDMIELTSWNDFGESHYLGPIRAEQPGSWSWTSGMPHTGWLSLIGHYAPAWKNGLYPSGRDQVILWSRPHPKDGTPTNPSMAKPRNSEWTDDNLYATVILSQPADVVLRSGGVSITYAKLPAGVNKLSMASRVGTIGAQVIRNGQVVKKWDSDGSFTYSTTFRDWNFNYFVQSF